MLCQVVPSLISLSNVVICIGLGWTLSIVGVEHLLVADSVINFLKKCFQSAIFLEMLARMCGG